MALGITVQELAVAIRVAACPEEALEEPDLGILIRERTVAEAMIEQYADDAPTAVKDEAAVLMVGHLYEMPIGQRNHGNAMRQSGAMSLLAFWRSPTSAVVGAPGGVTTETPTHAFLASGASGGALPLRRLV